jgi:ADP-dependent phosphofructokinase/glucokinase
MKRRIINVVNIMHKYNVNIDTVLSRMDVKDQMSRIKLK